MSLPITIPFTFATASSPIPLSELDSNFSVIISALNGVANGTSNLSNVLITGGNISNLATPLPVGSGGTGMTTLTANAVVIGNGAGSLKIVSPGASGNVLTSNGFSWTSVAAPTGTVPAANVISNFLVANGTNWASVPVVFNALAYGSYNDTAITAAITACSAAGGGIVYLPQGTWTLSSGITVPSGVTLCGAGRGATLLSPAPMSIAVTLTGSYSGVRHLRIVGGATTGIGDGGNSNVGESFIEWVDIEQMTYGISYTGRGGYYNRAHNIRLNNCTTGINLSASDNNSPLGNGLEFEMEDINIGYDSHNPGSGQVGVNASNINFFTMRHVETLNMQLSGFFIRNCNFMAEMCLGDSASSNGWDIVNTTQAVPNPFPFTPSIPGGGFGVNLIQCWASANGGNGFVIINAPAIMVGCQALGNGGYGIKIPFSTGSTNSLPVVVDGCISNNNSSVGIGIENAPARVSGCYVAYNSYGITMTCQSGSVMPMSVSGCTATHNTGVGIYFNYCLPNATGNTMAYNGDHGITFDSGVPTNNGVVSSNSGYGNALSNIYTVNSQTNNIGNM
jgi:hypothetical protein